MVIRHAYTGWPGCTHDARVLRNSSLFEDGEQGNAIGQRNFIIADSAYPLRNWLITPFRNTGHLTPRQHRFNRRLSSARQIVERCYGNLKGRFRRLKGNYCQETTSYNCNYYFRVHITQSVCS